MERQLSYIEIIMADAFQEVNKLLDELAGQQEPLGAEFRKVLHENAWELYEESPDTTASTEPSTDREMLLYLMAAFDSEHWSCDRCGHSESTSTMDSAFILRRYLSSHPQDQDDPKLALPASIITETDDWTLGCFMKWRLKSRTERCPTCNGRGKVGGGFKDPDESRVCSECLGARVVTKKPTTVQPELPKALVDHMRNAWHSFLRAHGTTTKRD